MEIASASFRAVCACVLQDVVSSGKFLLRTCVNEEGQCVRQ